MKSIQDIELKGKRVLIRCALNVPLDEKGNIADDFRLKESLATLTYAAEQGAKCVLLGHLGRPDPLFEFGNHPAVPPLWSLRKVAEHLSVLLGRQILFFEQPIGREVRDQISLLKEGEIAMLENMRFYKGEEANDENFAKELAKLGDIFINDAFAVCHRTHASIVGIPRFLPSGAGLLLEKEIKTLSRLLENPAKPLAAVIGGAKVQTKVKVIEKLLKIADFVLVGGLLNKEIKPAFAKATAGEGKIIGAGEGLDIPEADLKIFKEKIVQAKTVFWNGPLGKTEDERFSKGTKEVALAIIESGAFSVAGGGETVEFINKLGLIDKFSYVSTGGGAMMAYLSGEKLPGIEALK